MTFRACIVEAEIGGEHCKGYAKLADRFTMHPVCDLNEERGLALAGKFGAAFTRNLNVAILDSEIDVIDVCWPSHAFSDPHRRFGHPKGGALQIVWPGGHGLLSFPVEEIDPTPVPDIAFDGKHHIGTADTPVASGPFNPQTHNLSAGALDNT